jgi:hypothetical protein
VLFVEEHVSCGVVFHVCFSDEMSRFQDVGLAFTVGFVVVFPHVALRFPSEGRDIRVEAVAPMMEIGCLSRVLRDLQTHARGLQLAFEMEFRDFSFVVEAANLNVLGETSLVVTEIERTLGVILARSRNPTAFSVRVGRSHNNADFEIRHFLALLN